MELQLKIAGGLLIMLSLVHLSFPRRFNWKKELAPVSLINREMMYIHTFFIALMLLLIGVLCITSSNDLLHTPLGNTIALGFGIFFAIRLLLQFFGYSPEHWKGKPFETVVHVLISILWIYLSLVFLMIFYSKR
jgi:hypothetical protein